MKQDVRAPAAVSGFADEKWRRLLKAVLFDEHGDIAGDVESWEISHGLEAWRPRCRQSKKADGLIGEESQGAWRNERAFQLST